jgi:hypothetical protein
MKRKVTIQMKNGMLYTGFLMNEERIGIDLVDAVVSEPCEACGHHHTISVKQGVTNLKHSEIKVIHHYGD